MLDDHCVANSSNAHLDTSELERELNTLFGTRSGQDLENAALWPSIHDLIEKKVSTSPNEPSDDQLICRQSSFYGSCRKEQYFLAELTVLTMLVIR